MPDGARAISTQLGTGLRESPAVDSELCRAIEADSAVESLRDMPDDETLVAAIRELRRKRNAVILAHNYQIPEIQDIADFVGDSLQLAREAARTDAPVIAFCGVHFMAETAAILCPDRKVLLPDLEAGCSLAEMVNAQQVREWKADHPGAVVVAYINTTAEVKAEVDYCCTSSNATKVVASIPADRDILFLPDMFLGLYVQRVTGRKLHLWLGECHVHAGIRPEHILQHWRMHPGADLLLHPECGCVSQCMLAVEEGRFPQARTHVLSTGGMLRHARECRSDVELVGTEVGLLHRLQKENPAKSFVPIRDDAICQYMKRITLAKLHRSLEDLVYEVTVPEPTRARALEAIERMLAAG